MTPGTSGQALPEPSAFYDPATSCWRMSGGMFPSDSMPSLETLPNWGTTVGGVLYELPTPELPTAESASSSLLPSPAAMNAANDPGSLESWQARKERQLALGRNGNGMGTPLGIAVQTLLKTPTAQLAVNGGSQHPDKRKAGGHGPTLADEVEHLLPTPVVTDAAGTRNRTAGRSNPNSEHHSGTTLTDALCPLLPTPRATDGTKGGPNQRGSSGDLMLPSAVVQMSRGVSTSPPSGDGSEPPAQRLGQLSLDERESA